MQPLTIINLGALAAITLFLANGGHIPSRPTPEPLHNAQEWREDAIYARIAAADQRRADMAERRENWRKAEEYRHANRNYGEQLIDWVSP